MIGLVIVTHGGLASEFLAAMEHVVGPQRGVAAVCIGPEDDMERRRRDIVDAAAAVDDGSGVILLTDMFGGTPSNIASRLIVAEQVEAIAGVNLPMLVRALCYSSQPLETVISKAVTGGLEGVMYIVGGHTGD